MAVTECAARGHRARAWMSAEVVLALGSLVLLVGLWLIKQQGVVSQTTPRPTPVSDAAQLVVRGHSQALGATLAGGVRVSGTLYPALPGANRLTLTLHGRADEGGAHSRGTLRLRVTMPGMGMPPIRVVLHGQAGRYRGAIVLPMFGAYRAHVVLVVGRGQWQGTLQVLVPLLTTGM